jgi:MFS family permease
MDIKLPSPRRRPGGMPGFTIVWAGQLISVLASSMTQFALTIWAFREAGSATALGIVNAAFLLPFLLLAPIAGVMVDSYNRKLMMMVSDLTAIVAYMAIVLAFYLFAPLVRNLEALLPDHDQMEKI